MGVSTKVMVSFVKQPDNEHEVEDFKAYWEPKVDKVLIREMISNVGLTPPVLRGLKGAPDRWPCAHFFRRIVINHESDLKACPIDWKQETVVESKTQTSVLDAWHGDHYWTNRIEHLNNLFSFDSACRKCEDWRGTPWNLGYEKVIQSMAMADEVEAQG